MKAWWKNLSLHNKLQIPIQFVLLVVLMLAQLWVDREFEKKLFEDAEQKAISSVTQSFLGLNSMMLNGSINHPQAREIYYKKMREQDGVKDFHVVRGQALEDEYGASVPEEQARDELDRHALSSNRVQIKYQTEKPTLHTMPVRSLRVVVPFALTHDFHGTDCLQCHHVAEGEVGGAVSLTVSLEKEHAELVKLRSLLGLGQVLLQLSLFFLITFFIKRALRTVVKLEKTMLEIKSDGDLSKRAEVENNDEVGHIAQVFNEFLHAIGELERELADKLAVLENYQTHNEQEQRIASGYMNKLIALDKIRDADVQFYLKPAENFSGDLIAVSRTPDNRLHLLLADSTGHGLSAALAAMPMIHPFYSMTAKGFSISAIAKEINTKVCHSLPVSHFVAAILVSIDAKADLVEVWSGGCPPPVILNSKGECEHRFKPRHLAMGILRPAEFDDSVEYYTYTEGSCLMMFSDGVIELENENGEEFGEEGLLDAARCTGVNERWQRITSTIEAFGGVDNDDIALVMAQFNFRGSKTSLRESVPATLQQGKGAVVWQFALTLDISQIKKLDVVPLLLDIVQQIEKDKARGSEIFMILSEMFNNALDHGILKLDSSMKHHAEGMERYFEERAIRLENAMAGLIRLNLEKVINEEGHALLRIDIKDSGDGFDFNQVSRMIETNTLRHGRGIALLYNTCSDVHFLGNGSEVLVEYDLQNGQKRDAQ